MERSLRSTHRALLLTLGALAALPLACGGSKNDPPPASAYGANSAAPPPNGDPNAMGQNNAPPTGTMAAPPNTGMPPAGSTPPPANTAPPAGTAAAPTDAVVVALLSPLAAKYAPGMQPEGAPITANLAEGGHTQTTVTMQAGKCYTIVGASPPVAGVQNLNLKLLAPPFYTMGAGESTTKKNDATIGAAPHPTCPVVPIPVAYKLDVWSSKGGGPVAVQVYSKTK